MKNNLLKGSLVIAFFFTLSITMNAQTPVVFGDPGGPGSNGSGTTYDGGPVLPFDGRMSILLLASGLVLTHKRLKGISLVA